jgi:hypothetical protein
VARINEMIGLIILSDELEQVYFLGLGDRLGNRLGDWLRDGLGLGLGDGLRGGMYSGTRDGRQNWRLHCDVELLGERLREDVLRTFLEDGVNEAEVADGGLNKRGVEEQVLLADVGPVAEKYTLGFVDIHREEPPVEVGAVPDVSIEDLLSSEFEEGCDELLAVLGVDEEDLDCGGEDLELHGGVAFLEGENGLLDEDY